MNTKKSTEFSCFQIHHKRLLKIHGLVLFLYLLKSSIKSNSVSLLAKEKAQQIHCTLYHRIREWLGLEESLKIIQFQHKCVMQLCHQI